MHIRFVIMIDRMIGSEFPEFVDGANAVADTRVQAEKWLKEQGFKPGPSIWIKQTTQVPTYPTIIRAFIQEAKVI